MSHHSNGALLASFTKTHAIEVTPQNYNKTAMCWDGVLSHSPKSLLRRAFEHPPPIGREGLLICLLHFSLRVKGIMVFVVSQMLRQDLNTFRVLNISYPHHLAATLYFRGLLNTSISPYPQQYSISRDLGGLSNHLHFSYHPNNIPYPEGSLQLWTSSISADVYVLHREKPSWGDHSICGPWPRIPTW